jgi:HlyD family secretion protein
MLKKTRGRKTMKKKIIPYALVLALLASLLAGPVACNPLGSDVQAGQQVVEVVRGDLTSTVSGRGKIRLSNEVRLVFGSSGKVDKIYVEEFDEVSKGKVLAELEKGPLELALWQAKLALETSEYNLDKAEEVYTKPDIETARLAVDEARKYLDYAEERLEQAFTAKERSKWTYEVDRAERILARAMQKRDTMLATGDTEEVVLKKLEVEVARKAVAEAQRQLDQATITAPFDGIVASVGVEEQDFVPPPATTALTVVHLIDPTSMELEAEVDEIDMPGVKLGQKAIITLDALPALPLEGEVISVSPLSVEEAGLVLYEVTIGFESHDLSGIKAGMSADADIAVYERTNCLKVPSRAIVRDGQGNPTVKVMVSEEIEERRVVTGISNGSTTEILEGLDEGEAVLVESLGR